MEIDREIGRILSGVQPACVLMTANQLKIFDELTGDPVAPREVSARLNLSLKGTERLLDALTALNIAAKTDGRYRLNEEWKPHLSRDGDHCMQQWIQLSMDLLPVWGELPRFIQTGAPIKTIMEMLGSDPAKMRDFIDAMHDKGLKATRKIADAIPLTGATRMLDVGGGPGTYALEWARLHPALKATVFDIPPVLEVAKDYIQRYGLEDRVDTRAGDFTKDSLGQGYDLVLLANVLHMYNIDHGQQLVQKAVEALTQGGRIILHGFCTDGDGTGWLEAAGVSDIRHFRVDAVPTGVITGVKTG